MEKYLNKVIQGDCLEIMKELPDKCIDLVLTDPPYGIKADSGSPASFGQMKHLVKKYDDKWDSATPNKEYFDEILRIGKKVIIFGGNFLTDKLPVNGHSIVWNKRGQIDYDNPYGDSEIAWTNIDRKSVKKYIVIQQGFISEEKDRYHPTQKPLKLFESIINDYTEEGQIIYDQFLGSGTCLVAAKNLKRNFLGNEMLD